MRHFLIVFLIWNLLSVVCGVPKDDTYVGCFNSTSDELSNHGTVVNPLTWEICSQLCLNKVAIYAGVQLRKNTCFCTNGLPQSAEVDWSHCLQCLCQKDSASLSLWCGGNDTVSLYRLKPTGSSPLAILLATDGGISMVMTDDNSNASKTSQLSNTSATSVAYHYKNLEIFFISKNKVMKLFYMPALVKYSDPEVVIDKKCSELSDLDLDWENNTIYWACASSASVFRADLEGFCDNRVFNKAPGLKYLVVEPYARFIFYTGSISLAKYDLSLFKNATLTDKYNFDSFSHLAIDIQQEVIYVIGIYSEKNIGYLISLSYDYSDVNVVYQGTELADPCGLAAFNGTIFWCSIVNDNNYTLYRGKKILLKDQLEKVTAIFTGTQKVHDMKVYHLEAQSPSADFLCRNKNCSDSCSVTPSGIALCTCPPSTRANYTSVLANDSRTCTDIPNHMLYPQSTDYSTSTTESVVSLNEDLTGRTTYQSTDYTTEESSTRAIVLPSEHYTLRPTQSPNTIPNQELTSYLFYIILFLVLVVIISFQVYIAVRLRRINNVFIPVSFNNRLSEFVELS